MTTKLAISLPDELAQHARDMVRDGQAASVSAAIAQALARHRETETMESFLAEMLEASGGPASTEELAEVGRVLGLE